MVSSVRRQLRQPNAQAKAELAVPKTVPQSVPKPVVATPAVPKPVVAKPAPQAVPNIEPVKQKKSGIKGMFAALAGLGGSALVAAGLYFGSGSNNQQAPSPIADAPLVDTQAPSMGPAPTAAPNIVIVNPNAPFALTEAPQSLGPLPEAQPLALTLPSLDEGSRTVFQTAASTLGAISNSAATMDDAPIIHDAPPAPPMATARRAVADPMTRLSERDIALRDRLPPDQRDLLFGRPANVPEPEVVRLAGLGSEYQPGMIVVNYNTDANGDVTPRLYFILPEEDNHLNPEHQAGELLAIEYPIAVGRTPALRAGVFIGEETIGQQVEARVYVGQTLDRPGQRGVRDPLTGMWPEFKVTPNAAPMAGGVNNPMGAFAMWIGRQDADSTWDGLNIAIHGTRLSALQNIGEPVSAGCIRMTNIDIIDLTARMQYLLRYDNTPENTQAVRFIDEPLNVIRMVNRENAALPDYEEGVGFDRRVPNGGRGITVVETSPRPQARPPSPSQGM